MPKVYVTLLKYDTLVELTEYIMASDYSIFEKV